MKRFIFMLVSAMACLPSFAQFVLMPEGVKVQDSEEKKFVVIQCEGKAQRELYNAAKLFVNQTYNNPNMVISNVENESLTISAEGEIGLGKALGVYDAVVNYQYKISVYFKDNKIRVDVPVISFPYQASNGARKRNVYLMGKTGMLSISIYNPKKELREKDAKEKIESDINQIVNGIIGAAKNESKEDW